MATDWSKFAKGKTAPVAQPRTKVEVAIPTDQPMNTLVWIGGKDYPEVIAACEAELAKVLALTQIQFKPIKIVFNENMRTNAGTAYWNKREVHLNVRLLAAHPHELLPTFIHELCHIWANDRYGPYIDAHGYQWKGLMLRCGYEPERCHHMDVSELKRERHVAKVAARCGCMVHHLGPKVAKKIKSGFYTYRCTKCKTQIHLT